MVDGAALLPPVITIDGPAASGKGTVAALLARRLQFHYLDSGKIYRTVAAAALVQNLSPESADEMYVLATQLAQTAGDDFDHADISRPEISAAASQLAAIPSVRAALLPLQRRRRQWPGLVADGRDMGAVVFVDAILKIFLTADLEIRARRRQKQLENKQINVKIACVLSDLYQRDERDSVREGSPLAILPDSIVVDSSQMSVCQIVDDLQVRVADLRGNLMNQTRRDSDT